MSYAQSAADHMASVHRWDQDLANNLELWELLSWHRQWFSNCTIQFSLEGF